MEVTIKIPAKHREFLKSKGTLDFFVEAVALGQDELAKWTLLESGKNEIKNIMRRKTTKNLASTIPDLGAFELDKPFTPPQLENHQRRHESMNNEILK